MGKLRDDEPEAVLFCRRLVDLESQDMVGYGGEGKVSDGVDSRY